MEAQASTRIVILGKTGVGKSSLANTILGEGRFPVSHASISENTRCTETTSFKNGNPVTLIETPGFFDTCGSEELMKEALIKCITDCAPGPHAFLIVLKVEKYTAHEKETIERICEFVSEEAFRFATVVFTHGDRLEGMTIEEFTSQNEALADLVRKCGGRCHVVDNKYWERAGQDEYRNNKLQVSQILGTINRIIQSNGNSYYTNGMLQTVERELEKEEDELRKSALEIMPLVAIRTNARGNVLKKLMIRLTGTAAGTILGAFLGVAKRLSFSAISVDGAKIAAQSGAIRGAAIGFMLSEAADSAMGAVEKVLEALNSKSDSEVD